MIRKAFFLVSLLSLALMSFQSGYSFTRQSFKGGTPIFSDGFESGNFSAWDASVKDGGGLSVMAVAALVGNRGMRALIDDNHVLYVQDDTPNNEVVYDINFHFDPNTIRMANLDQHTIFLAFDQQDRFVPALQVELRFINGSYQVRARSRNDNLSWNSTGWFNLSDAEHQIEVEWDAATTGKNDGKLKLKLDGAVLIRRIGLDNDTFRIDRARLGAVAGLDSGTRGSYFFDQFMSFR